MYFSRLHASLIVQTGIFSVLPHTAHEIDTAMKSIIRIIEICDASTCRQMFTWELSTS